MQREPIENVHEEDSVLPSGCLGFAQTEVVDSDAESKGWYVAKTYRQERKIKERLSQMNIEHFIPFHWVMKEAEGKKRRVEVPLISGLIFVHGDKKSCISLVNDYGYPMRYLRNLATRSLLQIPDKQMENFIRIVDQHEDEIEVLPCDLKRGDRVRVIDGNFAGVEGELVRIAGHRRIVVRLENLCSIATVFIPSKFLEKITD